MRRVDECDVPTRLGDAPPFLPFRRALALSGWQLAAVIVIVGNALSLEQYVPLPDEPFQEGTIIGPMLLARLAVLTLGAAMVFIHPAGRSIHAWIWAWFVHFCRGIPAVYSLDDDERGPTYFPVDATEMTRMHLKGDSAIFEITPPFWWLIKHTPLSEGYWAKHVPYRMLLPLEPQGSLEMMTDIERQARWHALWAGLHALAFPIQFVGQTRDEDPDWLAERAMPPKSSPFAHLRSRIEHWARAKSHGMLQRRLVVACSAATVDELLVHVKDVSVALTEAGLAVRECSIEHQRDLFDQVWGARRFYPHPTDRFGIDGTDWVTIVVRSFPRHCVVGWLSYVAARLRVDWALYSEPDDAAWLPRIMEWFQGAAELPTATKAQIDAAEDLTRVEAKLSRSTDSVHRVTLLLTMPKDTLPTVANRLRKAGASFREARFEHQAGRIATLPVGGLPKIGVTRPLDCESVAGAYPFGADGLRMNGPLIGTARNSPEAVTLDLRDEILHASMVAILGATGAGKTFLMQLLIERSGLPFVLIDMKPHLDEDRHGDFYRFTMAAKGNYHVCKAGERLPIPHPFAQTYNLAMVPDADKPTLLQAIAEQEWQRAVDSLEDRIFGLDELYWLAKTQAGLDFAERIVSQGRSVGFIGICASQEVRDLLNNQQLTKAITMSSVQFVLAQNLAVINAVVRELELGGEAAAELEKFQPRPGDTVAASTRSAIMRVGQRMVSLRIEASPEETALFTTKPSDKRAQREERAQVRELAWIR